MEGRYESTFIKNYIMKSLLVLQNLKCTGCASTITSKLTDFDFVHSVMVDVDTSTVEVIYDLETNLPFLQDALRKLGYPIVGEANPITTKAKSYVSCAIGKIN
jgi:copper chaperone